MTPEEVRARVDRLRAKAASVKGDSEEDHGEEDAIYTSTLRAIAAGVVEDPASAAAEALKAEDIEFARWYA